MTGESSEEPARPEWLRQVLERAAAVESTTPSSFKGLVASLRPGSVQLLAGPHEMGQKLVAWCVAEKLAATRGAVLYFSMELSADELVRRVLSAKKASGVAAPSADLKIAIDDRPSLTVTDIWDHFDSGETARPKCAGVVIDGVERLVLPRRGNDEEERRWALAMDLRSLARTCDVVVIATCTTRPEYDGGLPPEYMKESDLPWQFRHEADAFWLHHRDGYFWTDGDPLLRVDVRPRDAPSSIVAADMTSGWPRWVDDEIEDARDGDP